MRWMRKCFMAYGIENMKEWRINAHSERPNSRIEHQLHYPHPFKAFPVFRTDVWRLHIFFVKYN